LPLVTLPLFASNRRVQDWLAAILLGVIEGITEFLPISSTGHLLLAEHWLKLPKTSFLRSEFFNVGIQSGAVIAVIAVFSERVKQLATRFNEPATRGYLLKLGAAFLLTAIGGLAMKKAGLKLPKEVAPIAWATLVGGVLFLVVERWLRDKPSVSEITWTVAIAIGVGQLVAAAFPGASRSGTTILVALALGLSRPAATEFSFLLGVPTLLAAGAYSGLKALKEPGAPPVDWGLFALGAIVSAATAFLAVRWLLRFIQKHTFVAFGWYRIALGGTNLLFWR
jgi:undecaprenyl-diphosphatase